MSEDLETGMTGRSRIATKPAAAAFAYPAKFRLGEVDDYVKYGPAPFEYGWRRGDPLWTREMLTQTWYQAETGRIPISGGAMAARSPVPGSTLSGSICQRSSGPPATASTAMRRSQQ